MFIIVDLGALIIFLAILGIGLGYTAVYGIQRSPFCFRTAVFRNQRPPIF